MPEGPPGFPRGNNENRQVGASVSVRGYHCRALATACIPVYGLRLATEFKVYGSFRKLGVLYWGVLIVRILLFRVLYEGSLFSETPL